MPNWFSWYIQKIYLFLSFFTIGNQPKGRREVLILSKVQTLYYFCCYHGVDRMITNFIVLFLIKMVWKNFYFLSDHTKSEIKFQRSV